MSAAGSKITFAGESCDQHYGIGLDSQMNSYLHQNHDLKSGLSLFQINQYAEDEPEEPDQSLLSICYDPSVVMPGKAFAYKNNFGATAECSQIRLAKTGSINVTYDNYVSLCPQSSTWPEYSSSKSSLVVSWVPKDGSPSFAIFGSNLPSAYYKGKNMMLQRTMNDIQALLEVSPDRIFIIGDMNTRLLSSAYDSCSNAACQSPSNMTEALELAEQKWEITPGRTEADDDLEPCMDVITFPNTTECLKALGTLQACRKQCMAKLACGDMSSVGSAWSEADPKRGAGGFDLLPTYFTFPEDVSVDKLDSSAHGQVRLPTYKRLPNVDVTTCAASDPFLGICASNPCRGVAGSSACEENMTMCFEATSESKSDKLPSDDPLFATVPDAYKGIFVKPQIVWLDSFGYSKSLAADVHVQLFQDRPVLTMGDHGAFVAAVAFSNQEDVGTSSAKTNCAVVSLIIAVAMYAMLK